MMKHRKHMLRYCLDMVEPGAKGICGCGHCFEVGEVLMGYPIFDGDEVEHQFVCLTCHFWLVHVG